MTKPAAYDTRRARREAQRLTSERDINRHCARVYLAEARRRRGTWFAPVLLQWAKSARRRSNEATQRDLFGRAA